MQTRVRAGIEPIVATIILVATALIISLAIIGYLMGLFGGLTGGQPQISVTSVTARLTDAGLSISIYLVNTGTGSDRLTKVLVLARGKQVEVDPGDVKGLGAANGYAVVPAGFRDWVSFELKGDIEVDVGDTVLVRLFFERSGQYTLTTVVSI